MFTSYTQLLKWAFVGSILATLIVWHLLVAFVSRYKKVYVLIHLLMRDESENVNHRLGLIDTKTFPWWLGWYRDFLQIKRFMFKGKLVRSLPFSEIQELYFRERTILIAITCVSLLLWVHIFKTIIELV